MKNKQNSKKNIFTDPPGTAGWLRDKVTAELRWEHKGRRREGGSEVRAEYEGDSAKTDTMARSRADGQWAGEGQD